MCATRLEKYPFNQGSEWRKWDLHVHSPFSFGGDYDEFIKNLKSADADVIGINDYYSIQGYKEIINKGGAEGKYLFPVIEFRMNNNLLDKNDERLKSGIKLNFHIIFDNDPDLLRRIETWLNSVECFVDGGNTDKIGNIADEQKRENKISVNFLEVVKSLKNDDFLNKHFLAWLPYDEYGGADPIDPNNDSYFKSGLIRKTSLIGSSNSKTINFFQWKNEKHTEEQICEWLNGKKYPCIKGSDSHSCDYPFGKLNNEKSEPINKYCWIKADPTFEGLKQVIYEPELRVYQGENPPSKIDSSKIIKSLVVKNSNNWIEERTYELNSDLISVIGGRGTGKTAVLDLIALTANKDWGEIEKNDNSFLLKAKDNFPSLEIELVWVNGDKDIYKISDIRQIDLQEIKQKVIYLSQGFVTTLCSDEKVEELQRQIENVIYQRIGDDEKSIYSDFSGIKNSKINIVRHERLQIKNKLNKINQQISDLTNLLIDEGKAGKELNDKTKEMEQIKKEIDKIEKIISGKETEKKQLFDKHQSLSEQKIKTEKEIGVTGEEIRLLDELLDEFKNYKNYLTDSLASINETANKLGIKESLTAELKPDNYEKIIKDSKEAKSKIIKEKNKSLSEIKTQISEIIKKLNIEQTLQKKLTELTDYKKKLDTSIEVLTEKNKKISDAKIKLPEFNKSQLGLLKQFFITLVEEKKILNEIYKPLEDMLEEREEDESKLFRFNVDLNFDIEKMADMGDKIIDHRPKGKFQGQDHQFLKEKLEELKKQIKQFNLDSEIFVNNDIKELPEEEQKIIESYFESLMKLFSENDIKELDVVKQISPSFDIESFYEWLLNFEYFYLTYSIEFDQKELDKLTPGLKGVALLILYLELDNDYKPILIDQPEENLDNRSIYNTLMKYFKNAKLNRQIIIASHNANLVVNTDSEQVIVANFDKDRKEQPANICYVEGALENSFEDEEDDSVLYSKGIRQHCWDVLEGGPEAFQKREQKYNFR